MTWTSFHRRGDILRDVIAAADLRRDGVLPMDVDGVAETFGDDLDLLAALQLRWHTRLAGRIEREQMNQPMDLEHAVVRRLAARPPTSSPASARSSTSTGPQPTDAAIADAMREVRGQGARPAGRDGRPGQRPRRPRGRASARRIESTARRGRPRRRRAPRCGRPAAERPTLPPTGALAAPAPLTRPGGPGPAHPAVLAPAGRLLARVGPAVGA